MKTLFAVTIFIFINTLVYSQWESVPGPSGGRIEQMTKQGNYLFAAVTNPNTADGGVFRSSDDGESWQLFNQGYPKIQAATWSITSNSQYIFVGTYYYDLYRSSDYGNTWELKNNGLGTLGISSLLAIGDTIYAGSGSGTLYKSTDNGENWFDSHNGLSGGYINFIYSYGNFLFAGSSNGIFRSSDSGANWVQINNGLPSSHIGHTLIGHNGYLFAAAANDIYRSSDNGDNWEVSLIGTGTAFAEYNGSLVASTDIHFYQTTDNGNSWQIIDNGFIPPGNATTFFADNTIFLAGCYFTAVYKYTGNQWIYSGYGITLLSVTNYCSDGANIYSSTIDGDFGTTWKSTDDGSSWDRIVDGVSSRGYNDFISVNDYIFGASEGDGIFRSSDQGLTWEHYNSSTLAFAYASSFTSTTDAIFVCTDNPGADVFKTTDSGENWEPTNTPGQGHITTVNSTGGFIFAGRSDGVYRSSDEGNNWEVINNGLPSNPMITTIGVLNNFICTGGNFFGLYRSTDYGDSWELIQNSLPNEKVTAITSSGNKIFSGTEQGSIYYSNDFGLDWNELNAGSFPGEAQETILSLEIIGNRLFAGVKGIGGWSFDLSLIPVELTSFTAQAVNGSVNLNWQTATEINNKGFEIQRSEIRDHKSEWQSIGFIQGNGTATKPHSYSYADNNVKTGTYSYRLKQIDFNGSFEYSKEVNVIVKNVPAEFTLSQNYPNPFNPSTRISFALPVDAGVKITIYNSLGQEVTRIVNNDFTAGNHDVNFNAANLSSGLYFYVLQANGVDGSSFTSTKKMMLLK